LLPWLIKERNPSDGKNVSTYVTSTLARMYEAVNSVISIAKLNKGILGPSAMPTSSSIPLVAVPKPKQTHNLTSAKGLCYFCDDPYSMEHIKVHK